MLRLCACLLLQANPTLPVVERLEDLWLLSRLQQERKSQQQRAMQQQQRAMQKQHAVGEQQQARTLQQNVMVVNPDSDQQALSIKAAESTAGHPDDTVQSVCSTTDTYKATTSVVTQARGDGVAASQESWLYDLDRHSQCVARCHKPSDGARPTVSHESMV
jgi:hypothetical protein